MSTEKGMYTYTDYLKLPESWEFQLIDGQLVREPAPSVMHQRVSGNLFYELTSYCRRTRSGVVFAAPVDVYLSDREVYQPDIVVILNNRLKIIGEERIAGAPNIVVELLSPSSEHYDLNHKSEVYERSGVLEYWSVDIAGQAVEVFQNRAGRFRRFSVARGSGTIRSAILSAFEIGLETMFSRG